jgi:hypothetical protein
MGQCQLILENNEKNGLYHDTVIKVAVNSSRD